MSKSDDFIAAEAQKLLQPGEQIRYTAALVRAPGILMQALLLGPLLSFLMTKAYYAIATNQRLIIIRTKMGMFGHGNANLGVEQYDLRKLQNIDVGGIANNRSMTFVFADNKQTFRIAPWSKRVAGNKAFFNELPQAFKQKQLVA